MQFFTLDTSCVIHAVQQQAYSPAIEQLVAAARAGRVALCLTAAFEEDMTRASNEHVRANLSWLAGQPILRPIPGPFRLDYSHLDGPDVLITDEQAKVIDAIEEIVLPPKYQVGRLRDTDPEFLAKWSRKVNDVQHLAAHYIASHDAFVTSDEHDIVSKREKLWDRARIRVYRPPEALSAIGILPH